MLQGYDYALHIYGMRRLLPIGKLLSKILSFLSILSREVEQLLTATPYTFPSPPRFYVLYVITGFRGNPFKSLERPIDPLRHGGIGPLHISTINQFFRWVFNIPSACHSFKQSSISLMIPVVLIRQYVY